MSRIIQGAKAARLVCALGSVVAALLLASCSHIDLAPHLRPLSKETMMLLGTKGMDTNAPIFVRIFKEDSELEVWKQRDDGRFYHFKTYPICNWSGDLGPKIRQGDKQAPEGFYTVSREQMNPESQYHLAFNLGYPNAYDRANRRTGQFLMVHGNCKSVGCYAMTDALIEEIYAIAREAFIGGQDTFHVHAFPFRMDEANMARHAGSEWAPFWKTLKEGYDHFELTRQVPNVAVCSRRYLVNVSLAGGEAGRVDPEGACPAFRKPKPEPFTPKPGEQMVERIIVPGPKMRNMTASADFGVARSGLTTSFPGSRIDSIESILNRDAAAFTFAPGR
jgi:murein L,D-transpeptidase YafK